MFRCTLLLIATVVSICATEGVIPIAGPWTVMHDDGSVQVRIELPGETPQARSEQVHVRWRRQAIGEPKMLAGSPTITTLNRPLADPSQLLTFTIPPGNLHLEHVSLWLGPQAEVPLRLPRPALAEDPARLVFISGTFYPSEQHLQRVAEAMGGSIDLAILMGENWLQQIGTGGWEHDIPFVVPGKAFTDERPGNWLAPAINGPQVYAGACLAYRISKSLRRQRLLSLETVAAGPFPSNHTPVGDWIV